MSILLDKKKQCDKHLHEIESILVASKLGKPATVLLKGLAGFLREHVEKVFAEEEAKAAKPVAMSDDETTQADAASEAKPSA